MTTGRPSAGWAIELTGEVIDLDDLREMLKEPFDPWVEDWEDEKGQVRLLLRTKSWSDDADSSTVNEHARRIASRLNGAKLVLQSDSIPVQTGAIFKFRADGTREPIIISASMHVKLRGARARGRAELIRVGPPPPPEPSPLQNWLTQSETNDDKAELFEHLARATDWYDIYKSAEIIRRMAGAKLPALLGDRHGDWKRMVRTANCYRHAPDPVNYPLPSEPTKIEEARSLLFVAAKLVQ